MDFTPVARPTRGEPANRPKYSDISRHANCISRDMKSISVLLALGVFLPVAGGQPRVSVGAVGGLSLTDPMPHSSESARHAIVGPSVELRLPFGFAVEVDALWQRVTSGENFTVPVGYQIYDRTRGNEWQFPILAKYYFHLGSRSWQPYVGAGYAVRKAWLTSEGVNLAADLSGNLMTYKYAYDHQTGAEFGAPFAAGVRFRLGRVSLSPEVRYTRWETSGRLPKNDAKLLLGVRF